jgi:hypothetical protein
MTSKVQDGKYLEKEGAGGMVETSEGGAVACTGSEVSFEVTSGEAASDQGGGGGGPAGARGGTSFSGAHGGGGGGPAGAHEGGGDIGGAGGEVGGPAGDSAGTINSAGGGDERSEGVGSDGGERCCYITVDSVTRASQNSASFYGVFLNRTRG